MRRVVCRTGEVFTDYSLYLRSKHWRDVKRRYYSKYPYKCIKCGWKKNIQLHHLTYERIGNERLTDLQALCVRCHREAHGLVKLGQPLKRNAVRKKWSWKWKVIIVAALVWYILGAWIYGE